MNNATILKIFAALALTFSMTTASAEEDYFGCKVMLCMSNPGGYDKIKECEPPMRRLAIHLAKGKPFPPCLFVKDKNGNEPAKEQSVTSEIATEKNCPSQYLKQNSVGEMHCELEGVVSVYVKSQLQSRTWWKTSGGTYTENFGPSGAEGGVISAQEHAGSAGDTSVSESK